MKLIEILQRRSRWVNVSTATMVALLQRTPVLRIANAVEEFVASTPLGAAISSAIVATAALGAVDSVAGATILADSIDESPSGALPSFDATVGQAITPLGFTITNTMNVASWKVTGDIPPGLMLKTVQAGGQVLTSAGVLDATTPGSSGDGWSPGTSGNNTTTPELVGTPTTAGSYTFNLQGFAEPGEQGGSGGTFVGTGISDVFPFTIVVSSPAVVTQAPVFTTQPISVSVAGGEVALDAVASNSPTYQWMLNGNPISGATDSTLVIPNATTAAGSYTCVATNSAGNATSNAAVVSLVATTTPGHLINISARANVGTGGNQIFGGFAVTGNGPLPVLIRASGPALSAFAVPDVLPDPELQFFNSQNAVLDSNEGWAGSSTIASLAAQVGAFAWSNTSSHDAALSETVSSAPYTAEISGQSGDTGNALVEIYDASPSGSFRTGGTRLINLAARVNVGAGANALFAGFVINGDTALTVLIRASGPAIAVAPFNVPGTLADPELTLQNASNQAVLATNAAWGGDSEITNAAAQVGAFGWSTPTSHDSALLITLPPGNYTAEASGSSGDTGVAIVEVYEVQ
ncbi:MAG TPA: immunoglobulin domain-containing protein [Opitutaceae bacterium]|jgi:hypothetical protein